MESIVTFFTAPFFQPYYNFAITATYSLLQNMDALGWVSYWSAGIGNLRDLFSFFYFLFLLVLIVFNIVSAFCLSKWLSIVLALLWLLPGIASVSGANFIGMDVPDEVILSDGVLYVGEVWGVLANAFVLYVLGWSIVTLLNHALKINDKFKNTYDHMWYSLALFAAVFFVIDSNTSYYDKRLAESEKYVNQSISMLYQQTKFAYSLCAKHHVVIESLNDKDAFCGWIDKMFLNLSMLSEDKSFSRQYIDAPSLDGFVYYYAKDDAGLRARLLNDIDMFNKDVCRHKNYLSNCEIMPFELGRYTDGFEFNWLKVKKALAFRELSNSINVHWEMSIKNNANFEETKNYPNWKFMYFILFGFLVGGKVANASRSLAGESKSIYRPFLKCVTKKTMLLLKLILSLFKKILNNLLIVLIKTYNTIIFLGNKINEYYRFIRTSFTRRRE